MVIMRKKLLYYIQPILPRYRKSLIDKFTEIYELKILADNPKNRDGFGESILEYENFILCEMISLFGGRLIWQKGVIKTLVMGRPDMVLGCANVRDISFWISLLVCKLKRIPFYAHGQGLYRKKKLSLPAIFIYSIMFRLIEKYVAYTELSQNTLINAGFNSSKIRVAHNTIDFRKDASLIDKTGFENGILFIGRLRDKCNLEELIIAIKELRDEGFDLCLHVIGDGENGDFYRQSYNYDWIFYYGQLFDEEEIVNISKLCKYGCYPGDAGLSVVHFFALKLPPIIHDEISSHMGPEPSYILNNVNGFLFNRRLSNDLKSMIAKVMGLPNADYLDMSNSGFDFYRSLKMPSLANKFCDILDEK